MAGRAQEFQEMPARVAAASCALGALLAVPGALATTFPADASATRPSVQATAEEDPAAEADAAVQELLRALEEGRTDAAWTWLERAQAAKGEELEGRPLALAGHLDELGVVVLSAPDLSPEHWRTAEALFSEALSLREAWADDPLVVADSLGTLSTLSFERGRYAAAEAWERRNLDLLADALGSQHPRVAGRRVDLAMILFRQGRYAEASAEIEASRAILADSPAGDPYPLIAALAVEAEVERVQNRFDEAEEAARTALDLARRRLGDDPATIAEIENNLAGILKDQGRLAEAEVLMRRAMATWQGAPDRFAVELSTATLNTAELLRLQGRAEQARPLYREALTRARAVLAVDDPQLAVFVNQAAVGLADLGDSARAAELYREALSLLDRAGGENLLLAAQTRHDLAGLELSLGHLDSAERLYREALEDRRQLFGDDHPETAATLAELARCVFLHGDERRTEALSLARSAVRVLADTPAFPTSEIAARELLAEGLWGTGDPRGAKRQLSAALDLVEALRPERGGTESTRAEFVGSRLELFYRMAEWLLEEGDAAAALAAAERGRARVLLDRLATAGVDLRRRIPPETLQPMERRERELEARIAELQATVRQLLSRDRATADGRRRELGELQAELDDATRRLQEVTQEIRGASPLWRELLSDRGRPAELARLREAVPPGRGPMLVYQVGTRRSYVYAVPAAPDPVEAYPLEAPAELAGELGIGPGPLTLEGLRQILAGDSTDATTGLLGEVSTSRGLRPLQGPVSPVHRLHHLWRLLVPEELRGRLAEDGEVVVVPDGPLTGFPLEALVVALDGESGAAEFWLDRGPVVRYAPSASVLLSLQARPPRTAADRSVLVVADPVFRREDGGSDPAGGPARSGWELPPLPGTAAEARAIAEELGRTPGFAVKVLKGFDADEATVRAALSQSRSHLHFATHGLVDESGRGVLAALALTPPESVLDSIDDGLLQLFEIYRLDLDAEIAVLSACSSNAGERVRGEGVFALSTGFLSAGVPRVVASQWQVDDRSTAELMAAFYRRVRSQLAAGSPVDYAGALRGARREVRARGEWSAPYHWAPFVLIGAP